MSILVALWLTLKASGRNWQMRENCKMASSLLSAPCLRFAQLKPRISSVLEGPFCVCLPYSPIQILPFKRDKEHRLACGCWQVWYFRLCLSIHWGLPTKLFKFQVVIYLSFDLIFRTCEHITRLQKNKNGWHMSLQLTVARRVSSANMLSGWVHRKKRSTGTGAWQ